MWSSQQKLRALCAPNRRGSTRKLDAGAPDHVTPALSLLGDECAELFRWAERQHKAL